MPAMETLRVINTSSHGPCRCLELSEDSGRQQYLMIGSQDGTVSLVYAV